MTPKVQTQNDKHKDKACPEVLKWLLGITKEVVGIHVLLTRLLFGELRCSWVSSRLNANDHPIECDALRIPCCGPDVSRTRSEQSIQGRMTCLTRLCGEWLCNLTQISGCLFSSAHAQG